ncbi:MAG: PA0069 family radical SAM protein [Gammaproteobacteria bacterium]|nr:PA0069 family radical SAM protein [Gammaproteobacteria bacterium]
MEKAKPTRATRGRGASGNPSPRFIEVDREAFDDGWTPDEAAETPLKTYVAFEQARSILSRNNSPDIPFSISINPYRGCEHGCIYCYARPSHAYLDLSPGLDFESRLFVKSNAAALLHDALAAPRYEPDVIALGANTDPYQPIERRYRITRRVVEVLAQCRNPFTITTKSALVERDIDLLLQARQYNAVSVNISVTTLDHALARRLEPRATAPRRRLQTIERLARAGIPVTVLFAPVIPGLNDHELESVLEAAAAAGAMAAGYVVLRLPLEVNPLFQQWLADNEPLKAKRVMHRVEAMRDGRQNDSQFGSRMQGSGEFATLLNQRMVLAQRRFGLDRPAPMLSTADFRRPHVSPQMVLF